MLDSRSSDHDAAASTQQPGNTSVLLKFWRALSEHAGDKLRFVMGPWLHGQESYDASSLGALEWGSDTAKWFRTEVLIPFLDANLKEGALCRDPLTRHCV